MNENDSTAQCQSFPRKTWRWQMIDDGAADRKNKGDEAKNALKNLLRSGIPGIENMFAGPADNDQKPMKKVSLDMTKGSKRSRTLNQS